MNYLWAHSHESFPRKSIGRIYFTLIGASPRLCLQISFWSFRDSLADSFVTVIAGMINADEAY